MNSPSEFGNPPVVPYAEAVANFRPEDSAAALHGSLEDGINACVECCDRHVAPGRIALEWESQDGRRASYTFAQLKELSARFAGFLKSADLQRVFIRQPHIQGTTLGNPGEFAALLAAVAQHCLRPAIHTRYPLEAARKALGVLGAGQQFGKIVLDIWTSHDAQLHAEHPRNEWLHDDHEQLPRDGLS